jgi:hypothetical protein
MAQTILATVIKSMGWLRGAIDASTYVSSLPSEGGVSAVDAVAPNVTHLRPLGASTIKAIWEARALTAGIVLGLVIIFTVGYIRSPWRKLPPSPRRLPILGNALQLRDKSWLFSKDCKERFGESIDYTSRVVVVKCVTEITGDVMYLDGAGQPIIVCNSLKSAFELLERRSSNYSDRPRFIMAQEILNGGLLFALMRHNDR